MSITPRTLSLKLQRKRYPAERTEKYIIYRGSKLDLTDETFEELLSLIPEVWNTDRDRLTQFVIHEDSTYFCVRNKDVYNYSLRESQDKTYFYNSATPEQVNNLVKILTDYFGKKKLQEVDNFYDTIISSLKDLSYLKQRILSMRETALAKTDYMFNSDYPFADAETEQSWRNYRQQWRDITTTDAWVNNELHDIQLPLAPKNSLSFALMMNELRTSMSALDVTDNLLDEMALSPECEEYETLSKNYGQISFKLEILKTLNRMKIPFNPNTVGNDDSSAIDEIEQSLTGLQILPQDVYARYKSLQEIEDSGNDYTMKSIFDEQMLNIDRKIQAINESLAEYDIDFTIGDILEKYVSDMKAKAEDIEREEDAERLITSLTVDEYQSDGAES